MRRTLLLAVCIGMTLGGFPASAEDGAPSFPEVKKIISKRCQTCHSEYPSQMEFSETGAPNGVKFDTAEQVKIYSPKIWVKATQEKSMPPGNITNITDGERDSIAAWIKAGANIN
jgi:uncharacterized membrane protein